MAAGNVWRDDFGDPARPDDDNEEDLGGGGATSQAPEQALG